MYTKLDVLATSVRCKNTSPAISRGAIALLSAREKNQFLEFLLGNSLLSAHSTCNSLSIAITRSLGGAHSSIVRLYSCIFLNGCHDAVNGVVRCVEVSCVYSLPL